MEDHVHAEEPDHPDIAGAAVSCFVRIFNGIYGNVDTDSVTDLYWFNDDLYNDYCDVVSRCEMTLDELQVDYNFINIAKIVKNQIVLAVQ